LLTNLRRSVLLFVIASVTTARAQDLPRGSLVDAVKCATDASQTYALYLPSTYSAERSWSLLMGFHPGGRGRAMVETYESAAEQYGYIVVGSNNSRNGPWDVSIAALRAMSDDVARRFNIDPNRVYLTGMSGGARVALQIALDSKNVAGVIASSAGFADNQPRASVSFPIFATAGTDDFNYIEMRQVDRKLTSPHYLALFAGGHTLPPKPVAVEAIEWLELQAIKSKRRARDETLVERLFEKRMAKVDAAASPLDALQLLTPIVADFTGLRDVSTVAARADALSKQPDVKKALARERADEDAEARMLREFFALEADLHDADRRPQALTRLRGQLSRWASAANAEADSPARSQARRVLRAVTSATGQVEDAEYRKLLEQYGLRGR
jgi:pimeloyl-ACP methyl ester carboxylesterase